MSRRAAIQKHLDNLFVYTRDYKPDGTFDVRQVVGVESESQADQAYYREVRGYVREQLEHVPDDILMASVEERSNNGARIRPLAIRVVRGEEGGVTLTELYGASTQDRKKLYRVTALHDGNTSEESISPEFRNRRGIITINWDLANPVQHAKKKLDGEGGMMPLIHELGHHWLDCSLTHGEYALFMKKFMEAVKVDKPFIGQALKLHVVQLAKEKKWDENTEYYCSALEALCGGDRRQNGTKTNYFNFEHCPNVLNVLLEYHPSWITQVSEVAPVFAAKWKDAHGVPQEINDSWAEAVASRKEYTPWSGRG